MPRTQITFVPDLKQLVGSLRILDLSENYMASFHNLYQVRFISLAFLKLSNTCMRHISLSNLRMPMLSVLHIDRNWITTMEPIGHLCHGLGKSLCDGTHCQRLAIFLGGNPWNCNGSLSWIYEELESDSGKCSTFAHHTNVKTRIADNELVVCQTPKQFCGKNIMAVCKRHFFQTHFGI